MRRARPPVGSSRARTRRWRRRRASSTAISSVSTSSLWRLSPGERDLALEERFGAFIDVVRAIRNVRQEGGVDPSARVKVSLAGDIAAVRDLLKQIGELTHSEVTLGAGEGTATVVRAIEIRLVIERDEAD